MLSTWLVISSEISIEGTWWLGAVSGTSVTIVSSVFLVPISTTLGIAALVISEEISSSFKTCPSTIVCWIVMVRTPFAPSWATRISPSAREAFSISWVSNGISSVLLIFFVSIGSSSLSIEFDKFMLESFVPIMSTSSTGSLRTFADSFSVLTSWPFT